MAKAINPAIFKETLKSLKQWPWFFGERAFLLFLIMIFMALFLATGFFFKYVILVQGQLLTDGDGIIFEKGILREILRSRQSFQKNFGEADLKDYPDLFLPKK